MITEYQKDLEADLAVHGPMYHSLKEIAKDIIENKQKIAFSCYCSPLNCHAEKLLPVVVELVQELIANKHNKKIKP